MKTHSTALLNFLNAWTPGSAQPYVADLLTIIQANGTITRLTSASVDVQSTSRAIALTGDATIYTFVSSGASFGRGATKTVVGLEVDSLPLTVVTDPTRDVLGALPWPEAVVSGALDGARIVLERLFMPTWGDASLGTFILFSGVTGDVTVNRTNAAITDNSNIAILANPMPRNQYQVLCRHQLYDAGCTLLKASFTVTGTVGTGNTASLIHTNLTQADHYFELGQITFTSGALLGLSRTVKSYLHASGSIIPVTALPLAPSSGDTFSIYPGCDKRGADAFGNINNGTCKVKFNNLVNFRGEPFIPVPETAG